MTSLHFVVQPLPVSADQELNDRLKEVSDKISQHGFCSAPVLFPLHNLSIRQCVIGASYIALLLEDGRVCRFTYSVLSDRLDLNTSTTDTKVGKVIKCEKLEVSATAPPTTRNFSDPFVLVTDGPAAIAHQGRWGVMTTSANRDGSAGTTQQAYGCLQRSVQQSTRGRRSGVIVGTRPMVPASVVPEELVNQCQIVLQGKSRSLIVRELQKTNLDVNLAVNNLLSRDDEGDDDNDEDTQETYSNGGDDLMSLLDSHLPTDQPSVIIDAEAMFNEDLFSGSLRSRASGTRSRIGDRDRDRDLADRSHDSNMFRIRDRRRLDSVLREASQRTWVDRDKTEPGTTESAKKPAGPPLNPLVFGDELQFWTDKEDKELKFSHISGLYSELVAISTTGQLHGWRWTDHEPYRHSQYSNIFYPKALTLNLHTEKVIGISTSLVRASVFTESGKVATWIDESLSFVAAKLEHPAQSFAEFANDRIVSLHCSSLYTCARLDSGALYWWGVMPFGQRRKLLEKSRLKKRKSKDSGSPGDISTGNTVCLKSSPLYHSGALAFTTIKGTPKVGQLLESAWSLTDTCLFKIKTSTIETNTLKGEGRQESSKISVDTKTDMPPPPSPASSTCSDHSGHSVIHSSLKRKKSSTPVKEVEKKDREEWPLKDVVFVEDIKSMPIGRVLKVDGAYAAVRFHTHESDIQPIRDESQTVLQDCRLLRKDDLMIVKGSSAPRVPDCFQRNPRKISLGDSGQILAVAVENEVVRIISRTVTKLTYITYNLTTGRIAQDSVFSCDIPAFMGHGEQHIALHNTADRIDGPVLLTDGNGAIYPLAKDCLGEIKDPQWANLPPVKAVGMATYWLQSSSVVMKDKAAIIAVAVQHDNLMPHILRCDFERVSSYLSQHQPGSEVGAALFKERLDGGRNILHACVVMCIATSNKQDSADVPVTSSGYSSTLEAINAVSSAVDALASIQSRSSDLTRNISLREMMRRATTGARSTPYEARSSDTTIDNPIYRWASLTSSDTEPVSLTKPPEYSSLLSTATVIPNLYTADITTHNMPAVKLEIKDRHTNAMHILQLLCDSPIIKPYLYYLLSMRNVDGCTPFMQAICSRTYKAAMILLDAIRKLAESDRQKYKQTLMNCVFPKGSSLDNSPLQVLCSNDTCSFTWTGAEHINQDIFECRTCGLLGSLCCCTERARVCHKGHDCKLKRTSPTAYCDCWERCKCKALIAGQQTARFDILNVLLTDTDLATLPNSREENILLFLVHTVGRQLVEQRQYRPPRARTFRKTPVNELDMEMPEHDLEPPRFARRALERILNDWLAVRTMILTGEKKRGGEVSVNDLDEDQLYLQSQSGTSRLDKFTHCLLFKCSIDMLDTLLTTLIREMKSESAERRAEACHVARRFVRSVVRIFVVVYIEIHPGSSRKKSLNICASINKPSRVFNALLEISVQELCQIANALIAPVRMGVARPTAPFSMVNINSDALQGSEEVFGVDPYPPRTTADVDVPPTAYIPMDTPHPTAQPPQATDDHILTIMPNNIVNLDVPLEGAETDADDMVVDDDQSEHHSDNEDLRDLRSPPVDDQAGESDMDLDLFAESESDSESSHSNQDNASVQRSAVTAATAGSDAGMRSLAYFSEDDSGDSSNADVDSDADTVDGEIGSYQYVDEQLERRTNPGCNQSQRTLQTPRTLR